jgi:predicted Fe-Mo cluster-binding NifX family protein
MKKLAFPTDDGETISRHLGESQFYLVAVLDDAGNITFEKREKPRRDHNREEPAQEHECGHAQRGPALFTPILDCQVLISGGLGQPAYDYAVTQGLEVILPAQKNIADALEAYRTGTLISDMRRVHKH